MSDSSSRFLFTEADIRGDIVRLHESFASITALHDYPPEVRGCLGEFLVAALLLSDTIKFEGRLTLQASGGGMVRALMAEATHEGSVRGIARLHDQATSAACTGKSLTEILQQGTLTVTVEAGNGERYQSIVPLAGSTLAACLESYFRQSEQLNTFIRLVTTDERAVGMLMQQLPAQREPNPVKRADQWQTAQTLAGTVSEQELLDNANRDLLRHLFTAHESVQLFDPTPVRFHCSCSDERMASALVALGEDELASLFEQTSVLELKCEFCARHYEIDAEKLTRLARQGSPRH